MRTRNFWGLCFIFVLCGPVFAQADGISVTVSRNVDLPPEEVYFSMVITADPTATLDDVLKASQALGLTAQNLTSVTLQQFGPSTGQTRLAYAFDLSVAISKFKETNDKVASVRRSMAADNPSMDLQIYGIAISSSDNSRDQARQGLLSPLMGDARKRADDLARAAGVTLGAIAGFSEAWANTGGYPSYTPFGGPVGPTTLKTAFSITVRFAVK